jgi:hypothetical protein
MPTYIEQWFTGIPSVTKRLFLIYLTTACIDEFLPLLIGYNHFFSTWYHIYECLTTFLFFGKFLSIRFLYELLLFVSYSKALEYEYLYFNRQKDFLICLLFGAIMILFMSTVRPLEVYLSSRALVFYIIYLYNNYKNPNGTTVFHPALFIDNKYMIFVWIFVSAFFKMFHWSEYIIGITAGYVFMALEQAGIIRTFVEYFSRSLRLGTST